MFWALPTASVRVPGSDSGYFVQGNSAMEQERLSISQSRRRKVHSWRIFEVKVILVYPVRGSSLAFSEVRASMRDLIRQTESVVSSSRFDLADLIWRRSSGPLPSVNSEKEYHTGRGLLLMTNIFIGNLDHATTEEQLLELFATYGHVESVTIVKDRDTGQARGLAFVEMADAAEAEAAINALNGMLLNGSPLRVNEARSKKVADLGGRSSGARGHRRHRI
jgi:hypothetical protein